MGFESSFLSTRQMLFNWRDEFSGNILKLFFLKQKAIFKKDKLFTLPLFPLRKVSFGAVY